MDAKSRGTMLKVVGIIFLIYGIIGIIMSIVAMAGGALVTAFGSAVSDIDAGVVAATGILVIVAGVISIVGGLIGILAGILGIKHNQNPAKAKSFIAWGIVYCVIELLSQMGGFNVWSLIFGLVLPAMYIYGGVMMNKENTGAQQ